MKCFNQESVSERFLQECLDRAVIQLLIVDAQVGMRTFVHPNELLRGIAGCVQRFCALRQREGVLAAVEKQNRRFHLADNANGPRFADLHAGFQPGGPENFVQDGEDRPLFGLHVQLEGFQKRCEQAFNHEMGDIGRKVRLCGCQHDGGAADADAVQHHVAAAEPVVREARPCDNVRPLAVVLQKNVLFSGTILENLRWGNAEATQEECERVCRLACADDFIQAMPQGYETYIEQGGTNVSGGQKQRLCIARALLKKPKILILDDSTSAVDTATDARIRKALREEIPNTTKIIIAQRISSVQDADRILVLDEGRVNGFGTHEQLLASNRIYQEVYQGQTQGGGDFDEKEGA